MQFYISLTKGLYEVGELEQIYQLNDKNIGQLIKMKDSERWDGKYDFIFTLIPEIDAVIEKAKISLNLPLKGTDEDIAKYVCDNPSFFEEGIDLKTLSTLFDIERFLKDGHMLHELFLGYTDKHFIAVHTDCLDYVHS